MVTTAVITAAQLSDASGGEKCFASDGGKSRNPRTSAKLLNPVKAAPADNALGTCSFPD